MAKTKSQMTQSTQMATSAHNSTILQTVTGTSHSSLDRNMINRNAGAMQALPPGLGGVGSGITEIKKGRKVENLPRTGTEYA